MSRRRISAVLFDLDGTVLDSEPVYLASDREFLARYGIEYDEKLNAMFLGRGATEMMKDLERLFPGNPLNDLSLDERVRLKDEAYARYARDRVEPFDCVVALARELSSRGVAVAIASGSSPGVIDATLDATGLRSLFPVRVSAAEVPRGKPAPDVFLEAARRLGVKPAACLVLEDSRYGVAAAQTAGMACVALPAAGSAHPDDFNSADIVFDGGAAQLKPRVVLDAFDWEPA
ncbi:MAG: HAD family phosphatase [Spirochaetales bacterium]|nr:HAD family phosphatase [Spirochaetales bacterium]